MQVTELQNLYRAADKITSQFYKAKQQRFNDSWNG